MSIIGTQAGNASWRPAFDWTDRADRLLGTRLDREVAEMLDIDEQAVARRRRRLGSGVLGWGWQ